MVKKYLKNKLMKLKEDFWGIITYFAGAYFLLQVFGTDVVILNQFFKTIASLVLIGLIVFTLLEILRDFINWLSKSIKQYISDFKEIKKIKRKVELIEKELTLLREKNKYRKVKRK